MAEKISPVQQDILQHIFDAFAASGAWPMRDAVRRHWADHRDAVDGLQNGNVIAQDDMRYRVTGRALRHLKGMDRDRMVEGLLSLIPAMVAAWRAGKEQWVSLPALASACGLSNQDAQRALDFGGAIGLSMSVNNAGQVHVGEHLLESADRLREMLGSTAPVKTIRISNLRGIRAGELEGFGKLTALVGINGCGKSTVLDALHLAHAPDVNAALREVAKRRSHGGKALDRWMFHKMNRGEPIQVDTVNHDGRKSTRALDEQRVELALAEPRPSTSLLPTTVEEQADHMMRQQQLGPLPHPEWPSALVDPSLPRETAEYIGMLETLGGQGKLDELNAILAGITRGDVSEVSSGTVGGQPGILIRKAGKNLVPLDLAGDGIRLLVLAALEMLSASAALLLMEEPETHLHPRAMESMAKAMVGAASRGTQVVFTTHSLEFLGFLNAEVDEALRNEFCLFRLALKDGDLRSQRYDGVRLDAALHDMGEDLR